MNPAQSETKTPHPGMSLEQIKAFVEDHGGLHFPKAPFRKDPAAHFTTSFGIDTTTPGIPIRVHLGTDRGAGDFRTVFAPFSGTYHIEESSDYGTLFRLIVEDEFEVRIGHMKITDIAVRSRANSRIRAGELIGLAGTEGKSTGIHTHTEVVSRHGVSALCEYILCQKCFTTEFMSPEDLKRQAGDRWQELLDDMTRKGVLGVSPVKVQKMDPWTRRVQTYYDSAALFRL